MFNFRSFVNYESLKKFFLPEFEEVRCLLVSNMFSKEEFALIEKELGSLFCEDFYMCLKFSRGHILPDKLLDMLRMLLEDLREIYEPKQCSIISANDISPEHKIELQNKLCEQYGEMQFEYREDENLVAGIIYKIDGKHYDGSFKKILFNIELEMQEDIK